MNLIVWVLHFVFVGLVLAVIARNTAKIEDVRSAAVKPKEDDEYVRAVRDRVERQ